MSIFRTIFLIFILFTISGKVIAQEEENSEPVSPAAISKTAEITAMFLDANKLKLLGNYDEAIARFELILLKNPEHSPSMYELAGLYLQNNRSDEAIGLMLKATKLQPNNVWFKYLLADAYKLNFRFDEMTEVYEEISELDPNDVERLMELAMAYSISGQNKNAIKTLDKLESKIGISEEISIQKQNLYFSINKIDEGIQEIEKLAEKTQEPRFYEMLAELYQSNDMPDRALKSYQKIVEIDPENAYIHISLSDFYRKRGDYTRSYDELVLGFQNPNLDVDSKVQIFATYFSEGHEILQDSLKTLELASILAKTHPENAKALSIYGDLLYRNNRFEESRTVLEKVISIDKNQYFVWEQLFFVLSELKDDKALSETSKEATELFPDQPLPYLFYGASLYQAKDYEAALVPLSIGSKLVVDNVFLLARFYTYLGDLHNHLKNYADSDEYYDRALKLTPDDVYVLNNYAYFLSLRNEKLDKAYTMAKKIIQKEPENPSYLDTYGWVLYKRGEYTEALEFIGKAIEKSDKPNGTLLEHYGDVLFKLDRKEESLKYWKDAKSAGEASENIDKKINEQRLFE